MGETLRCIVYKSRIISKILGYFATRFQLKLLSFYKNSEFTNLIEQIRKEVDFSFYPYEAYMLYSISRSQSKLDGDLAEVGVYQGGSAKIICHTKGEKKLHLFDTFSGLPQVTDDDTYFGIKYWKEGQFEDTSELHVKNYLSKYPNVFIYKGEFPSTAEPIKDKKFSFVHLDVDLYKSTLDSLEFFFPRLVRGGIILTHDYHSSGVQKAFDEFFHDKKIPIIELTGSQCMIVKTE